jgi:hypothetical protein
VVSFSYRFCRWIHRLSGRQICGSGMIKSGSGSYFPGHSWSRSCPKTWQSKKFKKGNSKKFFSRSWGYDHLSGADEEKCGGCLHAASASNEICNPGCEPLIFSSLYIRSISKLLLLILVLQMISHWFMCRYDFFYFTALQYHAARYSDFDIFREYAEEDGPINE